MTDSTTALSASPTPGTETPARRRVAAAGAGVGVVLLLAAMAGAAGALTRPLWLDEVVTHLEASTAGGVAKSMFGGVDFHPPVYAALASLVGTLAGGATPVTDRLPSLFAALLTIAVIGAALRARHSWPATLAGALALSAHPLFIAQAFEARPYALWILTSALAAESVREQRAHRGIYAAIAAILLCTTHYFGALSLGTIGAAVVFTAWLAPAMTGDGDGRSTSAAHRAWRALLPLLAGVAALLLILPLARAQFAAIGGRSWVSPATSADLSFFVRFPWGWRPAFYLILAGVLLAALGRIPAAARALRLPSWTSLGAAEWAMLSLALIPVIVAIASVLYTPVLVLRYSAPAAMAVAVAVAIAVERFPGHARWIAVAWLARAALFAFASAGTAGRDEASRVAADALVVRELEQRGVTTLSPSRHDAYQLSAATKDASVAWLVVADSTIDRAAADPATGLTRNFMLVERDFGRATKRAFDFPVTLSLDDARRRFVVAILRAPEQAPADSIWLPGFEHLCDAGPRFAVYRAPGTMPSVSAAACPSLRGARPAR